jgi:predicted NBD/HSP70 family sugar kinase
MSINGLGLKQLKDRNRLSILQAVREYGPVSRIELGRIACLSNTACMELTRELVSEGLIREKGRGDSSGGRKPVLLEINWGSCYVMGVILSGRGISWGIFDLQLNKVKNAMQKMNLTNMKLDSFFKDYIDKILMQAGIPARQVVGMTIGVGGVVDTLKENSAGSVHFYTKEIIHAQKELEIFFPFPVYLENHGNLAAFAEKQLFYLNRESLALIHVGEGIEGGVIKGNTILRGAYGYAGEIGHVSIDRKGALCYCGNRGCLETTGSIPALLRRASQEISSKKKRRVKTFMNSEKLTIQVIAKALARDDELAARLFEEEADILYYAVNSMILTYDPDVIVLSGDIVFFGQLLIDRIKQKIQKTIFAPSATDRIITFSRLKENPRVQGAGIYAIESFFNDGIQKVRHGNN